LADGARKVDDAAGLVCGDGRIGKVQVSLVELGLHLGEARLLCFALRSQRVDLPLRHFERRLGAIDSCLLSFQVLDVRGALLGSRPTLLDKGLVASPGDPRELLVRLHLGDLRLR